MPTSTRVPLIPPPKPLVPPGEYDHYALFGNPVAHSYSPFIHQQFAHATAQRIDYTVILATGNDFADALQLFFTKGGKGCNITAPFKKEAYRLCAQHTARAKAAQSVNTIKLTAHGLLGDNTDGAGLLTDLQCYVDLTGKRLLILGAGGAVQGILFPLIQAKPASVTVANRTPEKAAHLCREFAQPTVALQPVTFAQLNTCTADVIIHATSACAGTTDLPALDHVFATATLAYDLQYGVTPSPFLQQAAQCRVPQQADGLGMLVHQAAEAFYLWRGIYPDTQTVLNTLRNRLG